MLNPSPEPEDHGFERRKSRLLAELARLSDLVVAFSGGVDSSVLLHAAKAALGERALGLIADSPSLPRRELAEARDLASEMGARLVVLQTSELEREAYVRNDVLRCYWCKRSLFEDMRAWAEREGFRHLAFGEITDDAKDERPGQRAAHELEVTAPLSAAGFSKQDVRRYAREAGLRVHDKPASACLASRIPRGKAVTPQELGRVEAAEEALRNLGYAVLRVRNFGTLARVEVGAGERARAEEQHAAIAFALLPAGFTEIELHTYQSPGRSPGRAPGRAPGLALGEGPLSSALENR